MPPFVGRKRLSSTPPPATRPAQRRTAKLADSLDGVSKTPAKPVNVRTFSLGGDDSESSLSEVDSDEFEDVSVKHKSTTVAPIPAEKHDDEDEDEDEDDDIEWEDAGGQEEEPVELKEYIHKGDIQITLRKDDDQRPDYGAAARATTGKKGPTKREKEVRIQTHKMHVQFLLFHNAIRNSWIGDKIVQETLVKQLPSQIRREVKKWRRASGLTVPHSDEKESGSHSKKKRKSKSKDGRGQRDWAQPSKRLEEGKADLSHGDPLISLMKVLSAYWKKRFAITAPGLRKRGYGTKQGLKQDIASYRNDEHDPEKHGEQIRDLKDFRKRAEKCKGSRDLGAQLFTALLRGLGIEARMVASLQPAGYGWTKAEQMVPRKLVGKVDDSNSTDDDDSAEDVKPGKKRKRAPTSQVSSKKSRTARSGADKSSAIDLDSDADSDEDEAVSIKDDESIVDVTPSMPKQRPSKFDRDLPFPVYWTEAVSPVTHKILPVSPLVLPSPVASTSEVLSSFEPRGAKADKARQVMAYVVAHSHDGTAKDVTVRYLRKKIWPGKTKGLRISVEKIAVQGKRGKITLSEDYDWFKHIMMGYTRSDDKRTATDDVEDSTDLVPAEPENKKLDEGDTLQSLKSSADFVLERFLRREEALRPEAESVRIFVSGKGDKLREEPVYRRNDVERCLTAESWHKEGRKPLVGATPMKHVPVRAVTLTRKREAEEHEMRTGEKQMQGLYCWDQTEYIIPPPIKDGIIPKNSYGNMDCFVPSMVPRGAVHIPLRGTVRICKKLEIDFAEAVTGFEFGNKRAVPVCTGVVVASENDKIVRDAWKIYNEEQKRKEESKMEKLVLDLWRKFLMGLRIRERVQDTYGQDLGPSQEMEQGNTRDEPIDVDADTDTPGPGGILPEQREDDFGGGFLLPHDEDMPEPEALVMDHHAEEPITEEVVAQYPTPASVSPRKDNSNTKIKRKPSKLKAIVDSPDLSETETNADDSTTNKKESTDKDGELMDSKTNENQLQLPPPTSKPNFTKSIPRVMVPTPSRNKALSKERVSSPSSSSSPSLSSKDDAEDDSPPPPPKRQRKGPTKIQTRAKGEQATSCGTRQTPRRTAKDKTVPKYDENSETETEVEDGISEGVSVPKAKRRGRRGGLNRRDKGGGRAGLPIQEERSVKSKRSLTDVKMTPPLLRQESTIVTSLYFKGK